MVLGRRWVIGGLAASAVAGCAVDEKAPFEDIAAARFQAPQTYVALLTMVNHNHESGAHSGLLVSASERVIYDPAGTFGHQRMPERGDVHYGATDNLVDYYKRYHARFSHYVHTQRVPVQPDIAEEVLERTKAAGPAPKALCTWVTTSILKPVEGFTHVRRTILPEMLRRDFARIPGVEDSYVVEQEDRRKG